MEKNSRDGVLRGSSMLKAARAAAFIIWALLIVFVLMHRDDITIEGILSYTPESPLPAALAVQAMFALKSLTFVFYSGLLYIANGMLFPLPAAILLNMLGTMVMVVIPYAIGRRLGAEHADGLREKYAGLRKLEELRSRSGLAFVVLMRCVKVVNFDLGSMYMGAAKMSLPLVLAGSVLGMLPDIVLFPVIGANLDDPGSPAFWTAIGLDLLIAVTTVLVSRKLSGRNEEEQEDSGLRLKNE